MPVRVIRPEVGKTDHFILQFRNETVARFAAEAAFLSSGAFAPRLTDLTPSGEGVLILSETDRTGRLYRSTCFTWV